MTRLPRASGRAIRPRQPGRRSAARSTRVDHGVVSLAALDLRHAPDHRAELGSQLLLGEVVRLLAVDRSGAWWRVENQSDGYRGWVRSWGIAQVPERRARAWQERARARVAVPFAQAHADPGGDGALV